MKAAFKKLALVTTICMSVMSTSAVAFADAALDYQVTGISYNDSGVLVSNGVFVNTGDKSIESVKKVNVKLTLGNDAGDTAAIDTEFSYADLHLAPGESMEVAIEFPDAPYFEDATTWDAEEQDWEFTYLEEESAEEQPAAAAEDMEAAVDFVIASVSYNDAGVLVATGHFTNIGGKKIENITTATTTLTLSNHAGDSVSGVYTFTDVPVHIAPGESAEITIEFPDIPYFEDVTTWDAEEQDWEFTYFE